MRRHPRSIIVQQAECDMREAFGKVVQKHDLTFAEIVQILAGDLLSWTKWAIRAERHPGDPDKPGDIA